MREANKPVLGNEILNIIGSNSHPIPAVTHHIIDGGYLIQRIPWKKRMKLLMI